MAVTPVPKAMADVTVRHFLDGKRLDGDVDRIQRRMVYKDRTGKYFIKVIGNRKDVTRVEGTNTFICEWHGRTVKSRTIHEIIEDHRASKG
jgi:hypothetical protein